jgi:hypothetical protein
LAALGQFGTEPRAEISRWPFCSVRAVGIDHLFDHPAHIHDTVNLRPSSVVILLLNGVHTGRLNMNR